MKLLGGWSEPITQEILDQLSNKTTDIGNEIKVGDRVGYIMINEYSFEKHQYDPPISSPIKMEENYRMPCILIKMYKFLEREFEEVKKKFPYRSMEHANGNISYMNEENKKFCDENKILYYDSENMKQIRKVQLKKEK